MSSFNIADITDFLTSGAVFTREDGREARVLFLTNTALPEKLKAKFPAQVVYADENDNVLSCTIERFLQNRTFYNVQPELEARLNNLLAAPSTDSDEDVLDLMSNDDEDDELTIEGEDDGEDGLEMIDQKDDLADLETDIDTQEAIVQFTLRHGDVELPSIIDLDHLTAAVASYQQQPGADLKSIQHVLFIKAEAGVTPAVLTAVFSPINDKLNHTLEFAVDTDGLGFMGVVNWDTFIGVYPCVFYGSRMYQVVFSDSALDVQKEEIAVSAPAAVVAAPAIAPAVEVASSTVIAGSGGPASGSVTIAASGNGGGASGSGGNAAPAAGQVVQVKIAAPVQTSTSTAAPQA